MRSKRIDELFRSKLEGHTVAPGEQAWAKLQGKMKPASKTPALWMQVAAAVLLVLAGGWFFLRDSASITPDEKTIADQSIEPEKMMPPIEEPKKNIASIQPEKNSVDEKNTSEEKSAPPKLNDKVNTATQPTKTELADKRKPISIETMVAKKSEAEVIEAEVIETVIPEDLVLHEITTQIAAATELKVPTQEVRITYIAGEEERFLKPVRELIDSDKEKSKKSGFSKLLASAKNITSGDILAEIRETKDGLFSGNLKLAKEEKVNNSK